jgi:hypothetical protein
VTPHARAVDIDVLAARAAASIDERVLRDTIALLCSRASPSGGERALAEDVAARGRREHPDLEWRVDALDASSANLVALSRAGDAPELTLYGHLDTSLTGDATRDAAVTGETSARPALVIEGDAVRGFGVGVAKGPSAAALVAFHAAASALDEAEVPHRLTLLLAARGTHRAAPAADVQRFGAGVERALAGGWRPAAVLNVKGGPPGPLFGEPACAYLRVRLRRPWSAALARRQAAPDGGLARHVGAIVDAIEAWRERYIAAHPADGELGVEIAIGAIASGSPEKPDLLPGVLDVYVYAVLPVDADPDGVARSLAADVGVAVAALPGPRPSLEVTTYAWAPGGATDPRGPFASLAAAAWSRHTGASAPARAWTGATDGAILLARGIPTVRMGVSVARDEADPRVEIVSFRELVAAARAYADVAVRFFGGAA